MSFDGIGILLSLALLILLALRGVNIILASLISSLIIIVTNGLPFAESFNEYYSFGALGAFTFAGKFFLLFICGAIFGKLMGDSQAAESIAISLSEKLGAHRALLIATIACALLTYGGVVVFIVIFAVYPLGLQLLKRADIPKRLLASAIALGSGTFTLTALPGTPSIQNVISASALQTDLFAGALYGLISGAIMLFVGLWYLEKQRLKAQANGEGFVPAPGEVIQDSEHAEHPSVWKSCLPLAVVLLSILLPRLILLIVSAEQLPEGPITSLILFANSQPVLWPSIALLLGSAVCVLSFDKIRQNPFYSLSRGTEDAIMPLLNTAAVIGFGGIVTQTAGFQTFTQYVLTMDLPPLISMFSAVSLTSALVGSSSGGLQIFMQTMAQDYIAMGVPVEQLHRLATMASSGFDSLPHCGAIVAMLTITRLTHKEAYKDLAIVTVVIPVLATLVSLALAML